MRANAWEMCERLISKPQKKHQKLQLEAEEQWEGMAG